MKKLILVLLSPLLLLSPTLLNGQSNALNFDGTNDYVQTTWPGIYGSSARTVEAWIRTTANSNPNNGGIQKVICDWGTSATGGRFTFNLLWGNSIRLEVGGSGLSGTQAVNDGYWHHVAVVYDPLSTAGQIALYIDGSLNTQGNISTSVSTMTGPMRIGMRVDGVHPFEGDIDEVRVWGNALTANEINSSYNKEICNFPVNLVSYYKFNQGIAGGNNTGLTQVYNSVSNYNGSLSGFALNGSGSNWIAGAPLPGATYDTLTAQACKVWLSPAGNLITVSGTYFDTLTNAVGCDSIITMNITIDTVDTRVNASASTLTAIATFASYQWLDCDNGYAVIPGATFNAFTPTVLGNYAVEVTQNSCTDTSSCYQAGPSSINEAYMPGIVIFPNPTSGNINITFAADQNNLSIEIHDISGKCAYSENVENRNGIDLNLNLKPGLYIVHVFSSEGHLSQKLIIQ